MPEDVIQHLQTLKDQALTQSAQIQDQLDQGLPPDKLVSLLQTQTDTIKGLQAGIQELAQTTALALHKQDILDLQQALKELAEATQNQAQKASQKGVRLTGIGGKPYVPRRKTR